MPASSGNDIKTDKPKGRTDKPKRIDIEKKTQSRTKLKKNKGKL
jgi:hypothetical protein